MLPVPFTTWKLAPLSVTVSPVRLKFARSSFTSAISFFKSASSLVAETRQRMRLVLLKDTLLGRRLRRCDTLQK